MPPVRSRRPRVSESAVARCARTGTADPRRALAARTSCRHTPHWCCAPPVTEAHCIFLSSNADSNASNVLTPSLARLTGHQSSLSLECSLQTEARAQDDFHIRIGSLTKRIRGSQSLIIWILTSKKGRWTALNKPGLLLLMPLTVPAASHPISHAPHSVRFAAMQLF